MADIPANPAARAAEAAFARIRACIDDDRSFLLEAGAGAGKTFSLVQALKYVTTNRGAELLRHHQKVACITYTNVASDEITSRTDGHPAILSCTIHSLCWTLIRPFQPFLRSKVAALGNWTERLEEAQGVGTRRVEYDLGYPTVTDGELMLGHNDVLALAVALLDEEKFRRLFVSRYPILFIDEYQDTDKAIAEALIRHFLGATSAPLIGLFGDHWQKIYRTGCGKIESAALEIIGKESNFRSVSAVVNVLNHIRPELPQQVSDPEAQGSAKVYHTNAWTGERQTGQHWGGDLPPDAARRILQELRTQLAGEGWDWSPSVSKILMLTHNGIAAEQGYRALAAAFSRNEAFIQKEDPHIAFFVDILEPVCVAYEQKQYGAMFASLGSRTPTLRSFTDKTEWSRDIDALLELRSTGTIGQVVDLVKSTGRPRLPERAEKKERELAAADASEVATEEDSPVERLRKLRSVPYSEVTALAQYLDDQTPFSTKHGVKGAEFENVLVVCGRGWNIYNFDQYLGFAQDPNHVPTNRIEAYERNRNLFYVACSRPKRRLAVLFTQVLSTEALATLRQWFGTESIHALTVGT